MFGAGLKVSQQFPRKRIIIEIIIVKFPLLRSEIRNSSQIETALNKNLTPALLEYLRPVFKIKLKEVGYTAVASIRRSYEVVSR